MGNGTKAGCRNTHLQEVEREAYQGFSDGRNRDTTSLNVQSNSYQHDS